MGKRSVIHGVATHSLGKFKSRDGGKKTEAYSCWARMIDRCYSPKSLERHPAYAGCSVCEEWLEYQNFAQWHSENYIPGFAIDKDILFPGNKVYSPSNCCFVPTAINTMLTHASRKKLAYPDLPVGVTFCTFTNRYMAFMCSEGRFRMLGRFDSIALARATYLKRKQEEVRRMACKWRSEIGEIVYAALVNFPVEMEK